MSKKSNIKLQIVDAFIFYNELDLLELRFKELNDIVDFFILVEATHTFTGKDKPLVFSENRERFKEYLGKVIHVVVEDMPNTSVAWDNEVFQRNAIDRGVSTIMFGPLDLIMVTDCDEIPDSDRLREIKNGTLKVRNTLGFNMDLYYYNLNTRGPQWAGKPYITTYTEYCKQNKDCNSIRYHNKPCIEKGGWHLSYFGGPEVIQNKIKNISHTEADIPENTDLEIIKSKIENKIGFVDLYHVDITKYSYLPKNYKILI